MPFFPLAAAIAGVLAIASPAAAAQGRLVVRIADEAMLYAAPGRPALDMEGKLAREHGSAWVLRCRGDWLQIPTLQRRNGGRGWIRRTPLRMWQRMPSPAHPSGGLMAFHGGANAASVGTASSAGCFRMLDADLRRLALLVRAGTPVIIRA